MFALKQGNRYKKITERATRGNDTYNFETDIVHLGVYSISPYYVGVRLWNDLPLEIKNTHDTSVFNSLVQSHLYGIMNT